MSAAGGRPALEVSLVIVTHNSAEHVGETLEALLADPEPPAEVIVVDNGSTDGTLAIAERHGVDCVAMVDNVGFGAGCRAGATRATMPVLAFLNPDAVPRPGWLPPLVAALGESDVGAAMATIEQSSDPGTFNTSGGALTYFGLAWVTDTGKRIPAESGVIEVPFPSGAAMALRREVWDRLGGFRTDLFMYHEDTDLGWRIWMHGQRSVRVAASRVAHDYEFARNPRKMFYLERNRQLVLRTNYRRSTRWLLAPLLAMVEMGVLAIAVRDGWLVEKREARRAVRKRRDAIRRDYRYLQSTRTIGDGSVIDRMAHDLASITQVAPPPGTALAGVITRSFVRIVLPIIRSIDRRLDLG